MVQTTSPTLEHGALLIDKPAGISSFGVILRLKACFRKNLGLNLKFGHGGTLDPFASGLLVVFFGNGLKLARYFLAGEKSYEAVMAFGCETASGDPTTPPLQTTSNLPESLETIAATARTFSTTPYEQIPSMFSAKKIAGMPLYQLAREGVEISRDSKLCTLTRFDIHEYNPPLCRFSIDCSSGTYVRTLAVDLARKLGSLAHLQSLRRTACCSFSISQTTALNAICACKNMAELLSWTSNIPFDEMLPHINACEIADHQRLSLLHGKRAEISSLMDALPDSANGLLKLTQHGKIIAIARKNSERQWRLDRVFHW